MIIHYIFIISFLIVFFSYFSYLHKVNLYVKIEEENKEQLIVNKQIEKMFKLNMNIQNLKEQIQTYSLIAIICLYI